MASRAMNPMVLRETRVVLVSSWDETGTEGFVDRRCLRKDNEVGVFDAENLRTIVAQSNCSGRAVH